MAIVCKYHIEECENQFGKHYCKKCGRILNDNEIMNINQPEVQKPTNPEITTDIPKEEKENQGSGFKAPKIPKLSVFNICLIAMMLSLVITYTLDKTLGGWLFAFALTGAVISGFAKLFVGAVQSKVVQEYFEEKMPASHERSLYYKVYVGHWYGVYDDIWVGQAPDSAGGWDIKIQLQNVCKMPIHYAYFTVYPVDPFGKQLAEPVQLNFTGPLAPREKKVTRFMHLWYDKPIKNVVIQEVRVEFKNGESRILHY